MRVIKSDIENYLSDLKSRRVDLDLNQQVLSILNTVKKEGDQSLYDFTERFDGVKLDALEVSNQAILDAFDRIDPPLLRSLKVARDNIQAYHKIQLRASQYLEIPGGRLGEIIRPLERVGIYVPGGKAAYPSTVLMNALPAKLAGVDQVVMVTPPMKDGKVKDSVLVAAKLAGVDKIYAIGGAQAVAALTYGTESIEPVNKIVGPGNAYVATAKGMVSGIVGIDMIAGPSEILIMADQTSNPKYIAADMISQAEHDEKAAAITIIKGDERVDEILKELDSQMNQSPRKEIIKESLNNESAILIVDSYEEMIDLANKIAPEHLEILTENSEKMLGGIKNAGAVFVGAYSPEPLGDYIAGPNHTLPTSGTAMFSSPLGIDDFIKKMSLIHYTKEGLENVKDDIVNIADDEGLFGHSNAIKIRFGG
ncbi:histidinol dehydrogenase [Acidaminobacter sp. JC074]|uniref:histidinol dehydrogenase n=1 Tax=Acidaminobacter sp. JC074 TaxID=2530199 RepID=UPI001F0E79E1|nr:histidinol dehydrogenase [Acidaminobacter sp. JC074]MCH4888516.1 histidinol dehydrogenase [Acidaminobacter sp. JC074]